MLATLALDRVIEGRYRIVGVLGKGGMGTVFKAQDTALRRMVALKITTSKNAITGDEEDPQIYERFLREASLTAQLAHPNVVHVYDYGRGTEGFESFCYIAMELLQGEPLGERLRRVRTGLAMAEILPIMTQVARGLRAAHAQGLVHRDLKPDNIMLTPGEDGEEVAKILDFGLAKDIRSPHERRITDEGTILGTPEYMAPEQVNAGKIDARTDLYALGIVLYEMITGYPPFRGESAFRVATAQVTQAPPPMVVASDRPKPSLALQELVKKLLEKRPEARVQSADDLLKRLRDLPESRTLRSPSTADALSVTTTSRYQTGRKLSETARSVVYEATHMELGRQVALKVYRTAAPGELSRLKRELPSLALLKHPANVRVLDVGVTSTKADGRPFLVMDRIRGPTLRALLSKQGALPYRRAVALVAQILDGLAEAHAVGLLHRQLTPEHVLIQAPETRRESAKIIGYRPPEGEVDGSEPRLPQIPEPGYLAPEVMRGGAMSERSDLFAAGALLHECLLGRPPTVYATPPSRVSELPSSTFGDAPPELFEILRRSVSIDPLERYETATELADALLSAIQTSRSEGEKGRTSAHPSGSTHRLRSTGKPTVWLLTDDPALRKPPVTDVAMALRAVMVVEEISQGQREALAERIKSGQEAPPWVVVFGGMHVILEDPLLAALAHSPETARLLVSTHANAELLDAAINFCGPDQHVTLPAPSEDVRAAVDRMVSRAGSARRHFDEMRIASQRGAIPSSAHNMDRPRITPH